jgi:type IV pilus assembly protein PilM
MALIQRLLHNLKPMRSSLGLEITDRYVKLAEVVLSPEQMPKLRQYAIEELPPNTVVDGKIIQDLVVIALLRKMFQDHPFRSKQVHMVLPSQLIMVRFLKLPDIPLKDLKKVVEFEMKHNIHLPFDNPFYDFVKLNGTAESVQPTKQLSSKALKQAEMARIEAAVAGTQEPSNVLFGEFDKQGTASHSNELTNQCDVMLVASPKELIDDYTTIVEAAGLTPRTIEFKAMSLYRLVSSTGIVWDTIVGLVNSFILNELAVTPLNLPDRSSSTI